MTLNNILWILHTSYSTVKKYNFSHTPPTHVFYSTFHILFLKKSEYLSWGHAIFFLISEFCNGCSTHIPPFPKKAMPENFQTSWNRNKGNADWYSQLLSCSKWFWSQDKINKRTPEDNLFSLIGNYLHQNYEFMLQDQVLL